MLTITLDNYKYILEDSKKLLPVLRWGEVLFIMCFLMSCSTKVPPYNIFSFSGTTMGTTYRVKIILPKGQIMPEGTGEKIHNCLSKIDNLMSTYKPDSELSRFNQYRDEAPFPVSPETREVFRISLDIAQQTDGALDITVFPLVEIWGFGPRTVEQPPTREQVEAELKRVDYRKIEIVPEGIKKHNPEVKCDFSAVAKGYAVDKVAEILDQNAFNSYMIEVGGEVRVKGEKFLGTAWNIGIERPISIEHSAFLAIQLKDLAMATSGNYRNFYIWEGKKYSHEIDPHTGYPIPNTIASVSVIHPSCAYADAYATAFMVMGKEKAFRFAEENHIPALFIYPINETQFKEQSTSTWEKIV
ncbi:MAG TPA: FAD:protein FMN transferase, partial [Candidatus Hydrogenedens sp.]|nr:FAD:protein FMN transferase [Candidatus Hydrogenedens sp.]